MTDEQLLTLLREGDEAAFVALVERYGALMLRVASTHVRTRAVAEEVVQETWLAVLEGLDRFEGRCALKTWLFRILSNRAKTRGEREARCTPMSCLVGEDDDGERFTSDGRWAAPPADWSTLPEERLLSQELLGMVRDAIAVLPARQQEIVVLRDVEGWSAEEVCTALGLSEANQRVLLHRGRVKVRAALEAYQTAVSPPSTVHTAPVTYDASPEARNAMTAATSSGRPMRPRGTSASSRARSSGSWRHESFIGVSVMPGKTPLTRMASAARSAAMTRMSPTSPALLAE
jgi:RNA polymerase sigma-70 factor (ECF subfamily)